MAGLEVRKKEGSSLFVSHRHEGTEKKCHFSYEEYCDFDRMRFGVLRNVNDVVVQPNFGFEKQGISDVEVFHYVIDGEFSHQVLLHILFCGS